VREPFEFDGNSGEGSGSSKSGKPLGGVVESSWRMGGKSGPLVGVGVEGGGEKKSFAGTSP
jgi:hypothetical protein